eukprot:gene9220-16901_t
MRVENCKPAVCITQNISEIVSDKGYRKTTRCKEELFFTFLRLTSFSTFLRPDTADNENGFQERSSQIFQERCEKYRGSICLQHANTKSGIYMRANEDQDEIEKRLSENMGHIGRLLSPGCYPDALRVACITLFPPCRPVNGSAVPLKMCRESCLKLPKSHCAKSFELLPQLKIIQSIEDCSSLPETDANGPCAKIFRPGYIFKDIECKRSFRLKDSRFATVENDLEYTSGPLLSCENAHWKPLSKRAQVMLRMILPSITIDSKGEFSKSTNNYYCFRMPLPMSMLVGSKEEYSKVVLLPGLQGIAYDRKIFGFSLKLDQVGNIKQLTVPVGYLREYGIDKMVTIPNVTIYLRKNRSTADFFGEGLFNLCGTTFNIRIEQTKPDETLLTGRSPHPVDLSTVELAFGLRQPTKDLRYVMQSLRILKLRLVNPKLSIVWKDNESRTMRFSGQAFNSGWGSDKVDVELLLGRDQSFWVTAITTAKQSFKEIFSILANRKYVRLAKLLDMALDVDKVGFVLATTGVEVPKHPSLNFQHEPVKSMTYKSIPNGLTLEAHANVKDNCKRNDNRSFICQLVQFSAGLKASTNIRIHSNLKGMLIELKFHSNGRLPEFSPEILSKLRHTWKKVNPFAHVPESNVEISENPENDWKFHPRFNGAIWLKKLEIQVDALELFDLKIVHVLGDVIYFNKRYKYKINNISLSDWLEMLDNITEILKRSKDRR